MYRWRWNFLPEGIKILNETAQKHQFKINLEEYDFASCDYYEKYGKMLPDDWKQKLSKHDAIFFGAVGMPDRVPIIFLYGDHYFSLEESLIST